MGRAYQRNGDISFDIKEASIFAELGDTQKALQLLDKVPTSPHLYRDRASLHTARKEYDLAKMDYEAALALDPESVDSAITFIQLGYLLMRLNKIQDAEQRFKNALVVDPLDPINHIDIGHYYLRINDLKSAINEFSIAITFYDGVAKRGGCLLGYKPGNALYAEALEGRSVAFNGLNLLKRALADIDNAILLKDSASARERKSMILDEMGRPDDALVEIEHAIQLNKTSAIDRAIQARLLLEKGNINAANEAYEAALKLQPDLDMAISGKARICERQNDWKCAESKYAILLKKEPTDTYYLSAHAWSLHRLGMSNEAITEMNRAISIQPAQAGLFNQRGIIFGESGQFLQANADYDEALRLRPSGYAYYFNKASLLRDNRRYAEALPLFQKAVQLNGQNDKTLAVALADIEASKLEMFPQALQQYQALLKKYPSDDELHSRIAEIYHRMFLNSNGSKSVRSSLLDKSFAQYGQAAELAPNNAIYQGKQCELLRYKTSGDKTRACYDNLIARFPREPSLYSERAGLQQNEDAMIADYTIALSIREDANDYLNRGNAYSWKKDFLNALHDLDRAIQLDPLDSILYWTRSGKHEALGNWNAAAQDVIVAMVLDGSSSSGYLRLAHIYEQSGDFKAAEDWTEKALKNDSRSSRAYEFQGDLFMKEKKFPEAAASYQKALRFMQKTIILYGNGKQSIDYVSTAANRAALKKKWDGAVSSVSGKP